jgi:hypothetical protein
MPVVTKRLFLVLLVVVAVCGVLATSGCARHGDGVPAVVQLQLAV